MKKIIAKFLNAMRDRRNERKSTTEIEIGKIYHVKHTMRNNFYLRVQAFNDVWVEGLVMNAETLKAQEETILRRCLCVFTRQEDEKK